VPRAVEAQAAATDAARWSVRASAAAYLLPDDDDYLQPTVAADLDALHLEARYNYEDRDSASAFVGWNLAFGTAVTLQLTPMFGIVGGNTEGIIPALEAELTWRGLELYAEGEYVTQVGRGGDPFFYNWSEASFWVADWIRAGLVTQRTRVRDAPRDIQRGLLVGLAGSRLEGTVYYFNPGSDDHFLVTSFGVTF
jgi:hypothetical protein